MKKSIFALLVALFIAISASAEQSSVFSDDDLNKYKREEKPNNDYGMKISVDFQNANLLNVLKSISAIAAKDGVKIIVDPNITDIITIKEINRPWMQILAEIVTRYNLKSVMQDNTLFILSK